MLAFVSGAGRGIGAACALALAKDGCDVIINYNKSEAAAIKVAEQAETFGRRSVLCCLDVSDSGAVNAVCTELVHRYGVPDILVNNAGGGRPADRSNRSTLRAKAGWMPSPRALPKSSALQG